jgi:alanine racemase
VHISQSNLLHNLHTYQAAYPKTQIAPVLKSNAYGHGLVETASVFDTERISFFVLDSLHEAAVLRHAGIHSPLLVIGYTPVPNMMHARLKNIAFTITSISQLEELAGTRVAVRIHMKLDTGMHRQGLREEEWGHAQELLRTHPSLVLEGICSHFADADNADDAFTRTQCEAWDRAASAWKQYAPDLRFLHIAATSGVRLGSIGAANVIRVGLGLYGIDAAPQHELTLKPALTLETVLSSIKDLQPGEAVGYNATFQAERPMRIATIPMGYFEGIDRRLSNTGVITVRGMPCPIIGRISMNITTIDVSRVPDATRGDRAIVLSDVPEAQNSVEATARTIGTIPWEVLVHIPQHLRRTLEK